MLVNLSQETGSIVMNRLVYTILALGHGTTLTQFQNKTCTENGLRYALLCDLNKFNSLL